MTSYPNDQGQPAGAIPVYVVTGGGGAATFLDYSANKPALPTIGTTPFGAVPYAAYVLIATVPASTTSRQIQIENNSGAQILVMRDDGTAANGAAPANASVFALAGGAGAGSQGGSYGAVDFVGRFQIYAPLSSAQVAVMVN